MKFQPDKNTDAETNRRNYIFFTNKQIRRNTRNYSLPSRIRWLEKILMAKLWYYFRGQAREVEKYIKLAGYRSEEEIDELIFRTVGRTPKVELYQGTGAGDMSGKYAPAGKATSTTVTCTRSRKNGRSREFKPAGRTRLKNIPDRAGTPEEFPGCGPCPIMLSDQL